MPPPKGSPTAQGEPHRPSGVRACYTWKGWRGEDEDSKDLLQKLSWEEAELQAFNGILDGHLFPSSRFASTQNNVDNAVTSSKVAAWGHAGPVSQSLPGALRSTKYLRLKMAQDTELTPEIKWSHPSL